MRLIDADNLISEVITFTYGMNMDEIVKTILAQPTVDPVRHGRWIKSDDGLDGWCSRCKCDMPMYMDENWEWEYTETAYCPNCGAKMEGEEHETD